MPPFIKNIGHHPIGKRRRVCRKRICLDTQISDGKIGQDLRKTKQLMFGRNFSECRPIDIRPFPIDKNGPVAKMTQGDAFGQEMRQGMFDQK